MEGSRRPPPPSMSTYEVLAVVKAVRDRTGDPNAWQIGLAPNEIAAAITPSTRSEQLDTILSRIRRQHPDVFGAPDPTPSGIKNSTPLLTAGEAAQAMATAEAALAHQNSASSQLDLQVISAILNAHLKTVEGSEALTTLQQETEAAVRTRSDLDTPAGARDFQRFLISKLRDIRAVVANASLDDTSKSALMVAWTSLYDASKGGSVFPPNGNRPRRPRAHPRAAPPRGPDAAASGSEPLWIRYWRTTPACWQGMRRRRLRPRARRLRRRRWHARDTEHAHRGRPPWGPLPGALTGWGAPVGHRFPVCRGAGMTRHWRV